MRKGCSNQQYQHCSTAISVQKIAAKESFQVSMSEPNVPTGSPSSGDATTGSPTPDQSAGLKMVALDTDDLTVLSTNLQDAVVRVRDMAFVPKNHRFALILNRFNWTKALDAASTSSAAGKPLPFERRRCAVRFEHVRKVRVTGFSQKDKKQVLSLMAIGFEQARDGEPDGAITLLFAGDGAIRLEVECIEAELRDIGAGWRTAAKPDHPEE
jgi:hypothetical protein